MCHVAELCVYAPLRKRHRVALVRFAVFIVDQSLCRNMTFNLKHCKPICSLFLIKI